MNDRAKAVYVSLASVLARACDQLSRSCPTVRRRDAHVAALTTALQDVVSGRNGGFGFPMWATIVKRKGEVCQVTRSSANGDEWPGSRVISAQKANTANCVQPSELRAVHGQPVHARAPGHSLFGLQESNPVNRDCGVRGRREQLTVQSTDALVGQKIGGVNVFGGGLALYNAAVC
jgi:hypothetical protein